MASIFSHSILAATAGSFLRKSGLKSKILFLGIISSVFPDADVIMFRFGYSYEHMLGHRGLTHSIPFAFAWAVVFTLMFFQKQKKRIQVVIFGYLFFCIGSHGVLDAMTNGGRGIAFFAPFSADRYFFPFRPIEVSPLGAGNFFSEWGMRVLISEFCWIMLPCLGIWLFSKMLQKRKFEVRN